MSTPQKAEPWLNCAILQPTARWFNLLEFEQLRVNRCSRSSDSELTEQARAGFIRIKVIEF